MKYTGKNGEYFEMIEMDESNCEILKSSRNSELSLLWFVEPGSQLEVDAVPHTFKPNTLISLTEFHKVNIKHVKGLRFIRFNRSFYCILNHDSEVSCKGLLYYGASNLPVLEPDAEELETIQMVWKILKQELEQRDNLQLEMLQMLLKRIIILCTRIYKKQANYVALDNKQIDLIRDFNFLVEQHFRTMHKVADYAEMLHKSPKTLSNLFKKVGGKSPLQYIQERITVEAKRLLSHSESDISSIGYDLGFIDVQSFSRFFKKQVGVSPSSFRG